MKKLLAIAAIGMLTAVTAQAAGHVGQCVYPKTRVAKDGRLEFKQPVYILSTPNATDKQRLTILSAYTVKAEANGYIQLVTVPDDSQATPNRSAGKVVGWAKLSDFQVQDLRNCE